MPRLSRAVALALGVWALGVAANRSLRRVVGPSMLPTLWPGDLVVTTPRRRTPRPGDVVVIDLPGQPAAIKRVVAVGDLSDDPGHPGHPRDHGDPDGRARALIGDGHLHAHGAWWRDVSTVPRDEDAHWSVAPGEVVVLGDNRWASTDSRVHGTLPVTAVTRRVWARLSPWRWLPTTAPRRLDAPRERSGVRLVVLDPDDHVLLFEVRDHDDPSTTWLEAPGGGSTPGGDALTTAVRELGEEVGVHDVTPIDLGVTTKRLASSWGAVTNRRERILAVRVRDRSVDRSGWTASERRDIAAIHWLAAVDVEALPDTTVPAGLPALVALALRRLADAQSGTRPTTSNSGSSSPTPRSS